MKTLLTLSLLITVLLGLPACSLMNPENVRVFGNHGNTSISVPSGWNTNDPAIGKMFPAAVIAATDDVNHEYLAVIGEPKTSLGSNSTLDGFFAQIKTSSIAFVANGVWGTPSAITVDGLKNGLTVELTGVYRTTKANSTFFFNILENSNYYYAVFAFTDTALVATNGTALRQVINSFKAPATTVIKGNWKPYSLPQSAILAFILFVVGMSLVFLGRRLKHNLEVPHPSRGLAIGMITAWVLLILFIIGVIVLYRLGRTGVGTGRISIGPILPITLACAAGAFIYMAYVSRHDGILTALGRAIVCGAAGPMVFEFPFDMIVIPQIKATEALLVAEFVPLVIIVLLTLSLLLISKRVSITKNSLYALGAMLIVFAVWAWFGFTYPANPIAYVCNAISKILSFITVVLLFQTGSKQITAKSTAFDPRDDAATADVTT